MGITVGITVKSMIYYEGIFFANNCDTVHSHCSNKCLCIGICCVGCLSMLSIQLQSTPNPTPLSLTLIVGDDILRFTSCVTFLTSPSPQK